jgi:hypothetical protein
MMNIAQCLTSTSSIENLTLASLHFSYSPILSSPSQSPANRPWAFSHSFTENRVEDNDFQSNAAVGAARWITKDPCFPLTGLGIHYLDSTVRSEGKILSKSPYEEVLGPFNYNRRHRGTPRLDSCYTTVEDDQKKLSERALVEEDPVQLSPWTFSSMLKATEFAVEDLVHEASTSLLTENIERSPISNSNVDTGEYSLEKLSLVSGLSVELLAAQISATAEYTLQRLAAKEGTTLPTFDLDAGETSSATIGMRNFSKAVPPCIGVNPSEIMPPPSHFTHPSLISNSSCSGNLDVLASSRDQYLLTYPGAAPRSAPIESELTFLEEPHQLEIEEDKALHELSSVSEYSPISDFSSRPSARMLRGKKRKLSKKRTDIPQLCPTFQHDLQIDEQGFLPINFGTPVFDAHRGIHLADLKARAERYRLRNQGRDYDKKWLMSFAGKLTSRGALIEEFRCYVIDCQQRNKRRDHILIHVGGHLDQRPFKCLHWCVLHPSRSYLS